MNEHSYWREWPLAVFTVALQLACGFACTAVVVEWRGWKLVAADLASCALYSLAIAISVSLLHLGRPHAAWRALTNARHSRLSQEMWAVTAFGASAFVYAYSTHGQVAIVRLAFAWIAAALGVVAVIANARVYRVTAQPLWRRAWAFVSLAAIVATAAVLLPILTR